MNPKTHLQKKYKQAVQEENYTLAELISTRIKNLNDQENIMITEKNGHEPGEGQ